MNLTRQQGLTMWGWLMVIFIIGFFAAIALKTVPVYMENFSIQAGMEALQQQNGYKLKDMKKKQIYKSLDKILRVSHVRSLKPEHIYKDRVKGGGVKIGVKYDVVEPFIANISILMSFDESIELK